MSDVTTIKVSRQVRDLLQERALRDRRTLGQVVEYLVEQDERAARFAALRAVSDWSSPEHDAWEAAAVADLAGRQGDADS
ncbi:hypothetical protein [uncultured Amnibacterium sp.]|uniref:hypothetical protein n=1 Tax=uncultured Amnibacterium sp. TaxID=1631851 RepID=UPI0035CABD30